MPKTKTPLAEASITCFHCDGTITAATMTQVAIRALAEGWGKEQRQAPDGWGWFWICADHRRPQRG